MAKQRLDLEKVRRYVLKLLGDAGNQEGEEVASGAGAYRVGVPCLDRAGRNVLYAIVLHLGPTQSQGDGKGHDLAKPDTA